jgi:hypothetical protein
MSQHVWAVLAGGSLAAACGRARREVDARMSKRAQEQKVVTRKIENRRVSERLLIAWSWCSEGPRVDVRRDRRNRGSPNCRG